MLRARALKRPLVEGVQVDLARRSQLLNLQFSSQQYIIAPPGNLGVI